jgi:molybdopterin-binding protein
MKMKVGARNQLVGKVTGTRRGQVMAQVKFTIPAESQMSSVMTLESLDELGLREGDKVRVFVKAVNVLLMRE